MAKKKNFTEELTTLFYINITILILALSMFNLYSQRRNKIQVLGAETNNTNNIFWQDFMTKHPTYRDGWIELGRMDKVKQIDPNYLQEP